MPALAKPHDSLFRLLVADPGRAAVLLADYLPPEVTERLDPDYPPEHIEGTAIDGEGRATQADAIFRVRMKDGDSARIYVLLEHKSQPDARTPLQLWRYILRLWIAEIESGERPPGRLSLIIPMVFFHGSGPWNVPLSITAMIEAPEGLEHLARNLGAYILHRLPERAPDKLSSRADVAGVLLALVLVFAKKKVTDREADTLANSIDDSELGRYVLQYIAEKLSLSPERLEAALRRVGKEPEAVEALMGTAAQAWLEQGEARGEKRGMAAGIAQGKAAGIAEGKAVGIAQGMTGGKSEALARLLKRRFGPLPDKIQAHIAAATLDQLDRWLDAVLDAPTLGAIFGGTLDHR